MVLNRQIAHNRVVRHESGRPAVSGEHLPFFAGLARYKPIVDMDFPQTESLCHRTTFFA